MIMGRLREKRTDMNFHRTICFILVCLFLRDRTSTAEPSAGVHFDRKANPYRLRLNQGERELWRAEASYPLAVLMPRSKTVLYTNWDSGNQNCIRSVMRRRYDGSIVWNTASSLPELGDYWHCVAGGRSLLAIGDGPNADKATPVL
jgi:hypothetical protein